MPIYMDRHDVPGITLQDAAAAHDEDVRIQKKYGCLAMTYWVDEERETAFCLLDAPNKEAVKQLHDEAHGLIPHQIIKVDSDVVKAFLGRIHDPETFTTRDNDTLSVYNDPAFRAIMVVSLDESLLVNFSYGSSEEVECLRTYRSIIREQLKRHRGQEVECLGEGSMASFISVSQAVLCAIAIRQCFRKYNHRTLASGIRAQIGISAGIPVADGSDDFFGPTVQLANRLCWMGRENQIVVAAIVRELCKGENKDVFTKNDAIRTVSPKDEEFLNQLMNTIESVWNEAGFRVEDFGKQLGLSKSHLQRKITALIDHSPNSFINEFRLRKAAKLLKRQQSNVAEIAFDTGFTSPSYFSKCFQKRFGVLPSEYTKAIA